jgi:hypothetical protein
LARRDTESTLAGLRSFINASRWVAPTNRYVGNTVFKLQQEIDAGQVPHPKDLSQYIAASSLLHCTDGWSYLGKAVLALLRGDPHRARHLAYYAELRAATSLLATEGVGVFSTHHFALTAPNVATQLASGGGTHRFTWDVLSHWSTLRKSGELFARLVKPLGITLEQWFAGMGGSTAVAPQARAWFQQWGMDLQSFPDDRDARNISSYQPDGLPDTWQIKAHDAVEFVKELWTALEPVGPTRFEAIDNQILRASIEGVFKGRGGHDARAHPALFEAFAKSVLTGQGLSAVAQTHLLDFITRKISPNDSLILIRAQDSAQISDHGAEAVIARAALLLRIASGSTTDLFQAAGLKTTSLAFWSDSLGKARGLWETTGSTDATDLWADIDPLLKDIVVFQGAFPTAQQNFHLVGEKLGHAIIPLGGCERVAIWGMTA